MKKLLYGMSAMLMLFTFSCTVEQDEPTEPAMSNNPAAGKLYNEDFTVNADGGYASNFTSADVEKVSIYLTDSNIGCGETPDGFEWAITISSPRAIGTHAFNDATIRFKDPDGESFEGAFNVKVEIISVTESAVTGKVVAGYPGDQNYINGRFEVPYCN